MLGQSKTAFQAEIDAASEMIDFWRFNAWFAQELYHEQPASGPGVWNQMEYRALEGFVYAISPFNFTAIGGNLTTAPALMGNTIVWKPAATAMLSGYYTLRCLEEAGMPPGVINLIPGDSVEITRILLDSRELAGVHFTGSTAVFNSIWKKVGENVDKYRGYPRLVGETGGKDFIVVHPSADPAAVAVAIARGGFEYQGQKCSAASRVYVPESLWNEVRDRTIAMMKEIKIGDVRDFRNFMSAVIDQKSFTKISGYLDDAKKNAKVLQGGTAKGEDGLLHRADADPDRGSRLPDDVRGDLRAGGQRLRVPGREVARDAGVVDQTSPYALTGAVFSRDRKAVREATSALRNAAGNFYVNDKPTGAVVGQQPFGGARGSGTNDKAGSKLNLVRWVNARTIKETFAPPRDYKYPFMAEE